MVSLFLAAVLVAVSSELPISEPLPGPAAGAQTRPLVASNGDLALAAWHDQRAGGAVYASRIDRDGQVLDPLGIRLADRALDAVVWNGTHFAVFTHRDLIERFVTFVSVDGVVTGERWIGLHGQYEFGDAAGNHLLYYRFDYPHARIAIVDGDGDVVVAERLLPGLPAGFRELQIIAGSTDDDFLVLRGLLDTDRQMTTRTLATRVALDGTILSTHDPNLPVAIDDRQAVEGGPAGYALIVQRRTLHLYRLDRNGVFIDGETLLGVDVNDPGFLDYEPRIVRDGDGYLVVAHRTRYTFAARVPDTGATEPAKELWNWGGNTWGVDVTTTGGHRLAVVSATRPGSTVPDVFVQTLDSAPPVLLASSPSPQTVMAVAAGGGGSLVAYVEERFDGVFHHYVRRDGDEPVELHASRFPSAVRLASNGRTYLVTWMTSAGRVARRMNASTGAWRDAEPFAFQGGEDVALASNGVDAVATWSDGQALYAQRIRMSGDPLRDEPVLLWTSEEVSSPNQPAIASNGTDYLVAWSDDFGPCPIACLPPPTEIRALRLRADATRLDAEPLILEPAELNRQSTGPTVAWNRGRYVVAWTAFDVIRGASITAEGAIVETGVPLTERIAAHSLQVKLVAFGDAFALFLRRTDPAAPSHPPVWEAVVFDELHRAIGAPRAAIVRGETDLFGTLDAVPTGPSLVVAYDRIDNVARVFTRLFDLGDPKPRRRAVR